MNIEYGTSEDEKDKYSKLAQVGQVDNKDSKLSSIKKQIPLSSTNSILEDHICA